MNNLTLLPETIFGGGKPHVRPFRTHIAPQYASAMVGSTAYQKVASDEMRVTRGCGPKSAMCQKAFTEAIAGGATAQDMNQAGACPWLSIHLDVAETTAACPVSMVHPGQFDSSAGSL